MTAPVGRELSCSRPAAAPLHLEKYKVVNKVDASSGWERPDPCFPCLQGYFEWSFAFFSDLLTGWSKTSRIKMSANWKTCPGWCGYIENAKRHFTLYCYPMDEVAPEKMFAPPSLLI